MFNSSLSQQKDSLSIEIGSEELNDGFTTIKVKASNLCFTKEIDEFRVWKQDTTSPILLAEVVCNSDTTTLHIENVKDAIAFNWFDHNHNLIAQSQDSSFVVPIQKSTTFYASLVFDHGCVSDQSTVHVDVVRYDEPVITENQGLLYSNHSTNNQWSLDGKEILDANQLMFNPTTTGNYSLTIVYNGCVDSSSFYFVYQDEAYHVFPNPVESEVTIVAPREEHILRIEIINSSGQSIRTIVSEPNAKAEIVTLGNLTTGIYSLILVTTKKQYRTRILKK